MMNYSHSVVVWCYYGSRRKPIKSVFAPAISNSIEANYISYSYSSPTNTNRSNPSSPNSNSHFPVDPRRSSKWASFEIELQTLTMENKTTGDVHQICRDICSPGSLFSQGYEWVVKGDRPSEWITYDFDSSHLIEDAFSSKSATSFPLDLSNIAAALPYQIDRKGNTLTQTNIKTGKKRNIKRQRLVVPYITVPTLNPSAFGNLSNGATQQTDAAIAPKVKRVKLGMTKTGASLNKSASSAKSISAPYNISASVSGMSLGVPPSQDLNSTELEPVTESLPKERSIKITREKKANDKKSNLDIDKCMVSVTDSNEMDVDCIICMEKLSGDSGFGEGMEQAKVVVKLATCKHVFHKLCLLAMYKSNQKDCLECPGCKTIYGEKCGNCPPGEMLWEISRGFSIPGYEGYDVIRVIYSISPGIQGPEDPKPGSRYRASGFPRQGFLPDCNKGRKILKLLIEAFKRKLMFTIGTSMTTGQTDTVTWNEIHLKTEATSNHSGHGYPDPFYLDNVLLELASHGVC